MTAMIWWIATLAAIVLAAADAWTLRAVWRLRWPSSWHIATLGLLAMGLLLGLFVGCILNYPVAPGVRYVGFPFPALVLRFEDGRWIDYVGLIPVIVPFNVFVIASCALLPVTVGLLIRAVCNRVASNELASGG